MICSGYKIELFVIQDLINKMPSLYFAKDEEAMKKFTEEARATALANLEIRGGEDFAGKTLSSNLGTQWAGALAGQPQGERGKHPQHQGLTGGQTTSDGYLSLYYGF